jgi:hypothetical protein
MLCKLVRRNKNKEENPFLQSPSTYQKDNIGEKNSINYLQNITESHIFHPALIYYSLLL